MSWTDERVETLKAMWAEGKSASQIAKELGGVTRNAVIGKVHRLGLSNRVGGIDRLRVARSAQAGLLKSIRYVGGSQIRPKAHGWPSEGFDDFNRAHRGSGVPTGVPAGAVSGFSVIVSSSGDSV